MSHKRENQTQEGSCQLSTEVQHSGFSEKVTHPSTNEAICCLNVNSSATGIVPFWYWENTHIEEISRFGAIWTSLRKAKEKKIHDVKRGLESADLSTAVQSGQE